MKDNIKAQQWTIMNNYCTFYRYLNYRKNFCYSNVDSLLDNYTLDQNFSKLSTLVLSLAKFESEVLTWVYTLIRKRSYLQNLFLRQAEAQLLYMETGYMSFTCNNCL